MVGNSTKTVRKWTSLAFSSSFVIYPYRYWPKNSSQVLKGSWSLKGVCNLWSQWRKRFLKLFVVIYLVLKMKFLPQIDVLSRWKKMLNFLLTKNMFHLKHMIILFHFFSRFPHFVCKSSICIWKVKLLVFNFIIHE